MDKYKEIICYAIVKDSDGKLVIEEVKVHDTDVEYVVVENIYTNEPVKMRRELLFFSRDHARHYLLSYYLIKDIFD